MDLVTLGLITLGCLAILASLAVVAIVGAFVVLVRGLRQ